MENIPFQHKVINLCLRRIMLQTCLQLNNFKPRDKQVRTLRRLIFGKGNTLLIACTGFSKSLIFYTYSVLIGKITIQIIPLNKLGDKQLDNIKKIDSSYPVLINAKIRSQEKSLIIKIWEGAYMYILLKPKQALIKLFQDALKELELQSQIRLVAINECYLIKKQEGF